MRLTSKTPAEMHDRVLTDLDIDTEKKLLRDRALIVFNNSQLMHCEPSISQVHGDLSSNYPQDKPSGFRNPAQTSCALRPNRTLFLWK